MGVELTFDGYIETTWDALLLFEGCRQHALPKITRRLQESEKKDMVCSGAVFIFDEKETGIKRWTDGMSWSPSRTLGNFLVYRQLDKKLPKGQVDPFGVSMMDQGTKKSKSKKDGEELKETPERGTSWASPSDALAVENTRQRALVGSLTSTQKFRSDGLVKKTISLAGMHLVGYYRIEDVTAGRLRTPSTHPELNCLEIHTSFLGPTQFRCPPVVETLSDNTYRYVGGEETPTSPVLTRPDSSPEYGTDGENGESGSDSPPSVSPPEMKGSPPRRGASTAVRGSGRYEPYGARPQLPHSNHSYTVLPISHSYSPESSYGLGLPMLSQHEDLYRDSASTGLSPELAAYGWASTSQQYSLPPQVSHVSSRDTDSSFYQPRHSIPFHSHDNSESAQGIFAYNPPLQPAAMQTTLTPSPLYESQFSNPAYLQDQPTLPRFIPPPPSYSQGRAYVHIHQAGSVPYTLPTFRDQNQYSSISPGAPHEYGVVSHTNYSSTSLRTFPPPSYPEQSNEHNSTPSMSMASTTGEDHASDLDGLGLQDLHRDEHSEDRESRPLSEGEVDVDSLTPATHDETEEVEDPAQKQKRARGSSASEKGGLDEPHSASHSKRQPKEFLLWPGAGAAWHPTRGGQYVEARSE